MTPMQRHRLLALTPFERLAQGWQSLGIQARHRCVRGPETGMAMVRGRMGGSGSAFNLGEMTLTRASVALDDGSLGHGWVRGRDKAHAELIALVDACARHDHWARRIDSELMAPLAQELSQQREQASRQSAATRVDFFTMVRGE
ncbi:phosphonate C-P lyase system protein PhnG [Halomonas denitrificans]|nr:MULTISPECIES: phosphonate C-P lyase system protein PhnG [Halomonas]MBY6027997.1 phosphonate C-P lyase system protein PhnG [Halomonas sp. DP8Y7-1]MED5296302.1 phosphonate C-P lyase system protein PhnG [Pseudomonadota bacterium]MBN8413991.1 phosphonate C-P lyase system protein PhnG [Halomonas litopenaei]MBY5930255.1 phosphonate C-P lyase system protein PhnG [Halomonas sp. DP8Y7-3]MBY5970240.1 phosphonate C-P lyase system protein PhnG [Halomonas denitrificans]